MNAAKTALLFLLIVCSEQYSIAQSSAQKLNEPTRNPGTVTQRPSQGPSAARSGEDDSDEVLRVETTLITVPVSVLDRAGKFVTDLRQGDFCIYENGVEQPIAYFAAVEQPFVVFLLLDTSGSTQVHLDDIQEAAIAFVDQLRPHDQVVVATFDNQVQVLSNATSDRGVLRAAIRRTQSGGGTRLYDTVDVLLNRVLTRIPGRKAVVLFTDGWDTASSATFKNNIDDAEETDAIIYPISYARLTSGSFGIVTSIVTSNSVVIDGFPDVLLLAEDYLGKLADKTGGRLCRAEKMENVTQAFASIAEELRRQYSLGYYLRSPAKPGERRRIRVRVNRKDVAVKAREGYVYNQSRHKAK